MGNSLKTRYKKRRKIIHAAGRIFDHDLGLLVGGSENEIRMIDAIFSSISHSNHERLKRRCVQQFTNPRFH